jgi:hypothetical protein
MLMYVACWRIGALTSPCSVVLCHDVLRPDVLLLCCAMLCCAVLHCLLCAQATLSTRH